MTRRRDFCNLCYEDAKKQYRCPSQMNNYSFILRRYFGCTASIDSLMSQTKILILLRKNVEGQNE